MTQRQHMNLVVNPQRTRGMHEGFVAEAVKRLGIPGRSYDAGTTDQLAVDVVFKNKEVALFAIEADFGGERSLGGSNLFAQALGIVG